MKQPDAHFLTTLYIRRSMRDYSMWELTQALIYFSKVADRLILVPTGTQTDFASVPRVPFAYMLFANLAQEAAVLHDFAYQTGMVPRKMADAIFKEAIGVLDADERKRLEAKGASRWMLAVHDASAAFKRNAMHLGVRIGGGQFYKPADPS